MPAAGRQDGVGTKIHPRDTAWVPGMREADGASFCCKGCTVKKRARESERWSERERERERASEREREREREGERGGTESAINRD